LVSSTPVLDLKLYDCQFAGNQVIELLATAVLSLSASYYNPKTSYWEPIIEKCGFDIDIKNGSATKPYQVISMEINQNYDSFLINVSY